MFRGGVFAAAILSLAILCSNTAPANAAGWWFDDPASEISGERTVPGARGLTPAEGGADAVPTYFVHNKGQINPRVKYYAAAPNYTFFATPGSVVYSFRYDDEPESLSEVIFANGRALRVPRAQRELPGKAKGYALHIEFAGASKKAKISGRKSGKGRVNFFQGKQRKDWRTGIGTYGEVVYRNLYPKTDISYASKNGVMKYDITLRPGADPSRVAMKYRGDNGIRLDHDGNLIIDTPIGELRDDRPTAYQVIKGKVVPVDARFTIKGGKVHFAVGDYDHTRALVIDPGLTFSTFIGGSKNGASSFGGDGTGTESARALAIDSSGSYYVVGSTRSSTFPATPGAYDESYNEDNAWDVWSLEDVFVAKLSASGEDLLFATYVGSGGAFGSPDFAYDVALDTTGDIYVVGNSTGNFPTTAGAYDTTSSGNDAFIFKLSNSGSTLRYSSFLGSGSDDYAYGVAVDAAGSAYITGETYGADFPASGGAYDTTFNGVIDGFVTKMNPSGSALAYSTFIGGSSNDTPMDILVDATGDAFITGRTYTDTVKYPTTAGAYDTSHNGWFDLFVTKIAPSGASLVFSTFIGGSTWDEGRAIALDTTGDVYVAGGAGFMGFTPYPTTVGAYDRTAKGTETNDGIISKLSANGSTLLYSTYLGGTDLETIYGLTVDGRGRAHVTGYTTSTDFPTTPGAFDRTKAQGTDAFVARLNATASVLAYSTYLGGSGDGFTWLGEDIGYGIQVNESGDAFVAGQAGSYDFPSTAGAYDTSNAGMDAFVARIAMGRITTLQVTPAFPDGSNGWYTTVPRLAMYPSPAGSTYYKWDSDSPGGWTTYGSTFDAIAGEHSIYYYSIAGGETETPNHDIIKVDTGAPTDPIVSADHPANEISTLKTITASWTGGGDDYSGVDGYSVEWSQSPATTPDTVQDLEEDVSQATSVQLSDGDWYFHLRTVDKAGNWSSGVHYGPMIVKGSPHGGFAVNSNLCKVCHQVHQAGLSAFRLIRNGNTTEDRTQGEGVANGMGNLRLTECMYCHDSTAGLTNKKPYELGASPDATVRGEHTLGAERIPDSNVNSGGSGWGNLQARGGPPTLQCYQCHSVHGANTIGITNPAFDGNTYDSSDNVESWNTKILRVDPAGDGTILASGSQGTLTADVWTSQLRTNPAAVRTGFCADCHNQNPNWTMTTDDAERPNPKSHPQGPGADSKMEAYGDRVNVAAHPMERMGCRGCHYATDNSNRVGTSRFPHQSTGWKLLYDEATSDGSSGTTEELSGSPYRGIPKMDAICLTCHQAGEEPAGGYAELEESTCLACHTLSRYGAPDIGVEIAKASAHPITTYSGRHSESRTGEKEAPADFAAPNDRHAECIDCHSPQDIYPWDDGPLTGIWGIGVVNGVAGTVPTFSVKDQVEQEYELCFKCHSGWTTQPTSSIYVAPGGAAIQQQDKAREFNTNNSAFHPVEGPGRNVSSNLNDQLASAGLSTASVIKCTDCHNSDRVGDDSTERGRASNSTFRPKGPHGANNNSRQAAPNNLVLRAYYYTDVAGPTTWDPDNFALCFLCHDQSKLIGDGDADPQVRTNFYLSGWGSLHREHLVIQVAAGITCRNCHYNLHSNQGALNTQYKYKPVGLPWVTSSTPPPGVKTHLVNFSPDIEPVWPEGSPWYIGPPQWSINLETGQRECYLTCHGHQMGAGYQPLSGDDVWTY